MINDDSTLLCIFFVFAERLIYPCLLGSRQKSWIFVNFRSISKLQLIRIMNFTVCVRILSMMHMQLYDTARLKWHINFNLRKEAMAVAKALLHILLFCTNSRILLIQIVLCIRSGMSQQSGSVSPPMLHIFQLIGLKSPT